MRILIKSIGAALLCALACTAARAQQTKPIKCSTFEHFRPGLPPGLNGRIASVARTELQTSILSPSKHFRIHYDTTGDNTPAMTDLQGMRIEGTAAQFVDTVAKIFDSVWTAEVTTFGFAAPPSDNGAGGGDEYDIYIEALEKDLFGETVPETELPSDGRSVVPRYTTYIRMDNDYVGFRTQGIAAVMSTAAHEFHHAIQFAGYGIWSDHLYFYELTAEAMEPTVFPYSKDYVNDVGTYFDNIEKISLYTPFTSYHGYERAIWSVFLMKRYGPGVMRQIWEAVATEPPVAAMKAVLEQRGTTLPREFSEFCFWNYFTGPRADTVRYYPDAKLFPLVNVRERETLGFSPVLFQYPCKGFGVNYLEVMQNTDTASFIIVNTNMDDALGSESGAYSYRLRVSNSGADGGAPLMNGMYGTFSVTDPGNWKYVPLAESIPVQPYEAFCYPNPFNPSVSKFFIRIGEAGENIPSPPNLSVFSASYDRVFTGAVTVENSWGIPYAVWDGMTTKGGPVGSGIYFYILQSGGTTLKGKFAVIR